MAKRPNTTQVLQNFTPWPGMSFLVTLNVNENGYVTEIVTLATHTQKENGETITGCFATPVGPFDDMDELVRGCMIDAALKCQQAQEVNWRQARMPGME